MNRDDASRYLEAGERLCAMKIGGWAPHELHEHEAEEVARDQAEGVRLAYVAATRARDLLVVPALGDAPWDGGWFGPLNRALYPPPESRRRAERGPKCPAFKSKDSVLERPNDEPAGPSTVCPGQHTFADGYSVVWWDPGALALGARPPFGVRREELIVKDVAPDVVADGRTRYDRWRLARIDARAAGGAPSVAVATVREWTADQANRLPAGAAAIAVTTADVGGREQTGAARAGGAAFGVLVHAILAQTPFDAGRDALDTIARVEARVLGLGETEVIAAAEKVESGAPARPARPGAGRGDSRRVPPRDAGHLHACRWHARRRGRRSGVRGARRLDRGGLQDRSRDRGRRRRAVSASGGALRLGGRGGDGQPCGRYTPASMTRPRSGLLMA